ncbi:response regulator transcription factor [Nocardioides sp. NBC_00368]|uniref:response regulator transcription factor n=1 Tax=Nocardioides sp. NBC_00368 TaxID=2976000 RepID=UPI002E1B3575
MRVLVVEDEPQLAESVAEWLRQQSHAVDVALDGGQALERVGVNEYDVVVLDRDLPVVHGDQVCHQIVGSESSARVLMLTAAADVTQRVAGLALGADDYLTKPFAFPELAARVLALGRRSRQAVPPVLRHEDLTLDPSRREVFRGGRYVPLARKEFGVLAELMMADGAPVSAEHLLEKVWDEHADPFTNAVRVTLHKLRRKLGDPPLVETVTGVGYRLR